MNVIYERKLNSSRTLTLKKYSIKEVDTLNYKVIETSKSKKHTINVNSINTLFYDYIKDVRLNVEIFRNAYINQRKQYKLLRAYIDLTNEHINDEDYEKIEEECIIEITKYNEKLTKKVIFNFLKNHLEFKESYNSNELSELLGLDYKEVRSVISSKNK